MANKPKPARYSLGLKEVARYYIWSDGRTIRHYMDQEKVVKERKKPTRRTPENGFRKMVAILCDIEPDDRGESWIESNVLEVLDRLIKQWDTRRAVAEDEKERYTAACYVDAYQTLRVELSGTRLNR